MFEKVKIDRGANVQIRLGQSGGFENSILQTFIAFKYYLEDKLTCPPTIKAKEVLTIVKEVIGEEDDLVVFIAAEGYSFLQESGLSVGRIMHVEFRNNVLICKKDTSSTSLNPFYIPVWAAFLDYEYPETKSFDFSF